VIVADSPESAVPNESTILQSPETELMRQQWVIDQITHILIKDTFSLADRHEAVAQLRKTTDYGTGHFRILHLMAIGEAQRIQY
jgi:hypothetical protein